MVTTHRLFLHDGLMRVLRHTENRLDLNKFTTPKITLYSDLSGKISYTVLDEAEFDDAYTVLRWHSLEDGIAKIRDYCNRWEITLWDDI